MLLSEKLTKMFNDQINKEFYSAYLYLGFANYFSSKELKGFAKWYTVQASEELEHGKKMIDYMLDQGRTPELKPIDKVKIKFADDLSVGKAGLTHEEFITSSINKIYKAAADEKDYRTMEFLDWFIKEQNEEEANACSMVALLKQIKGNDAATFFADSKVGERE